ncbi:MAG: DUF2149 domain-containing protein [Sulfuricurvum sp.]
MKLLQDDESLNPILSAINMIDLFLVIIAVLLITIVQNPLNPFSSDDVTVVKNANKPNMEVIVKKGKQMQHYKSSGEIADGDGIKAGVTYKLKDGNMIYVPQ